MDLALAPGAGFSVETISDLDHYLATVAAAGFSTVSLGMAQLAPAQREPRGFAVAAEMLEDHGLRCSDVIGLIVRRDDAEADESARSLSDAAHALGAEWILTLLFTRVTDESLARLDRCAGHAAQAGARLALEIATGGPVGTITQGLAVVESVGADRMGVLIDTWHFFRGGSTFAELETIPLDRIALVQFDDALAPETEDVMHETMDRRTWPGQGELDLARFADVLTARGWEGVVSVEVLSAELRRLDLRAFTEAAYATTRAYWNGTRE